MFLGLGTNQGDLVHQLSVARDAISQEVGQILLCSSLYLSEPWGQSEQPWFMNQVILVETHLTAAMVLHHLLLIEKERGRVRQAPNAPRTLDLDILFYDDAIIAEPGLTIPHPRLAFRNFVLIPMMEIAGDTIHPVSGMTIEELYEANDDPLEVCMYEPLS